MIVRVRKLKPEEKNLSLNLSILKKVLHGLLFFLSYHLTERCITVLTKTLISVSFDQLSPIHIFKTCFSKVHSVSNIITCFSANRHL
jgi:hypothetical protein